MLSEMTGFVLYMWISFYVFLLPFTIILVAKLMQYFRRWGEVKSSRLEYSNKILELSVKEKSFSITSTVIKSQSSQNLKKLLLIPPFTVSSNRYLYLATAFSIE